MIPNITKGGGVSGAIKYVMGQGKDADGRPKELKPGEVSRAEIIGGQNFGFEVNDVDRLELARRMMEWNARPENQASRTKPCVKDALHLTLSWHAGYTPDREEMERASREALKALGMERAQAVFVAHHDTAHSHVHIVASRIDPTTGRTFSDTADHIHAQAWSLRWERENNQITEARRGLHNIVDMIEARDGAAFVAHLTERQSVFTAKELDRALAYGLPDKAEREKFRLEILASPNVIGLRETADATVTHYTTRDVLEAERAITRAAERMQQRGAAGFHDDRNLYAVSDSRKEAIAAAKTLLPEQRDAVFHAAGSAGFAIIAGEAGTGKSWTFNAIREGYEAEGFRVIGMSWTNAVVQDMRTDGFKNASTIAAELKRLEVGASQWDSKTILMVDEAAMLSTKHLAALMTRADEAGAKVILAGDAKQLASVERGGMFPVLSDIHGVAELKAVQRTKNLDNQRAFNLMHEGEFGPALDIFDKKGAINWAATQKDALQKTAERYAADVTADPSKRRFIFAYTNEDVAALNDLGRKLARHEGRLQGEDTTLQTGEGATAFAKGDRIQFTGNAADRKGKNSGLVNGAVGTVTAIEEKKGRHFVSVELDGPKGAQPRRVTFVVGADKAKGEFETFRHGYAGTIYKGQGRTLDQTYVYHSKHWRAASSYVALTRHRESVAVFVARETVKDLKDLARQIGRDDQKRAASGFYVASRADQLRAGFADSAAESTMPRPTAAAVKAPLPGIARQTKPPAGYSSRRRARHVQTAARSTAGGVGSVGAGVFGSLLAKLFGAPAPLMEERTARKGAQKIDPTHLSEEEVARRRAALAARFGRELDHDNEQQAAIEERRRQQGGMSQR